MLGQDPSRSPLAQPPLPCLSLPTPSLPISLVLVELGAARVSGRVLHCLRPRGCSCLSRAGRCATRCAARCAATESSHIPCWGCAKPSQTQPRGRDSGCLPAWVPGEAPAAAPAPLRPRSPSWHRHWGLQDGATSLLAHLLLQAASPARARRGARSLLRLGKHHSSSRLPGGSFRLAQGYYRGVIGKGPFVPGIPWPPDLSWVPSRPPGTAHFLYLIFFFNFLSMHLLPKGPI